MVDNRKNTETLPAKKNPLDNLRKGGGRPKGVPNKNSGLVKDMILQALDKAGGADYLAQQAIDNPGPFMTLVGKVLPTQITGDGGGPISLVSISHKDADL